MYVTITIIAIFIAHILQLI